MELSVARQTVEKNIDRILKRLCIKDWLITMEFQHIEDGVLGRCFPFSEYKEARITLDYEKLKNKEHLLEILTHELLHCVVSEMNISRNMVREILSDHELKMFDVIFANCEERVITHIELILDTREKKSG